MTREEAKSELMQLYMSLSEEKKQALDVLINPLSEEDYIELRDRFGSEVKSVVRDMVSGKGERWEQAQTEPNYLNFEDTISREAVLEKAVYTETEEGWCGYTVDVDYIKSLPSVNPQEKTGHWIHTEECDEEWQYRCSKCNMPSKSNSHRYCSNCGSYMYGIEPQESEENNG